MLLFSTMLDVTDALTKEAFVDLVIEWNNTAKYKENIIPDIVWNDEESVRYEHDKVWMDIEQYEDIIAVRFEKQDKGHIIWDTDYVLNLKAKKLAIRLDRSYTDDASISTTNFSTPHFITLLIEHGYLKKDGKLPIGRTPIPVGEKNLPAVAALVKGEAKCRLPLVLVTKTVNNEDPVNVDLLASRLKGVAHVLVMSNRAISKKIKSLSKIRSLENGNIGIVFPEKNSESRCFPYRRNYDVDTRLLERVVHVIARYAVAQNYKPLYTWMGVNNALLARNVELQKNEKLASEALLTADKEEAYQLMEAFDDDLEKLRRQVEELTRANEALTAEVYGLRNKLNANEHTPVVYFGEEEDFFEGEIKNIVMDAIKQSVDRTNPHSRRWDVLKDILDNNEYEDILTERQKEVKRLLKGYKVVNAAMKQSFMDMGFEFSEEGKHYKLSYYGDNRYWSTLAKTPSDNRTGNNIASDICGDLM